MGLNKIKLGKYVELYSERCNIPDLTNDEVSGVNKDKEFFEPSNQVGTDTSNYKVVPPNYFACNLMHVGRDVVLPIAYNHSGENKIVSPAYTVFKFKENSEFLSEYFFLCLKTSEKDRYFWFKTDSSVRDGMSWSEFTDVDIDLPPLSIQQKYVDIYNAMTANQKAYETGLEDLKLVCDGYIEDLRRKMPCEEIGKYIVQSDTRNERGLTLDAVRGLSVSKELITTKANMSGVSLNNYKIVSPKHIAYVPDTSRRGDKVSLGFNDTGETYIVSSISTVFTSREYKLLPEYLMLFFSRSEFDRYARFHSWGSARETFDWEEMCDIKIPIPDIKVQGSIVNIYKAYKERQAISEQLKTQIKDICPILIKGSIEEAKEA